jgi:hypothetical protein
VTCRLFVGRKHWDKTATKLQQNRYKKGEKNIGTKGNEIAAKLLRKKAEKGIGTTCKQKTNKRHTKTPKKMSTKCLKNVGKFSM